MREGILAVTVFQFGTCDIAIPVGVPAIVRRGNPAWGSRSEGDPPDNNQNDNYEDVECPRK